VHEKGPQEKGRASGAAGFPVVAGAIVVAAGESTRMGGGERKPFRELAGRTLLERSSEAFDAVAQVRDVVLVVHPDDLGRVSELARRSTAFRKVTAVVPGGAQRTDSVRAGVEGLAKDVDVVLVHDAARPLVRPATIAAAVEVAFLEGAALVAVPVRDTLKSAPDGQRVSSTVDRAGLWAAQTPQGFRTAVFRDVLARAARDGYVATDDAALYERYVGPVALVRGEETNLKITTAEDLALAEAILRVRAESRR
jgi:2-C-methyl-D-erythritol 4-phosphate cytidylyltransferase